MEKSLGSRKAMVLGSEPVDNILLLADSYKISHHLQYPPGTTSLYSYFESRGGKFPATVFFGFQYILKRWLCGPVLTSEKIDEAKEILSQHLGNCHVFNEEGWRYILERHEGYLPLRIRAVPEGSVIPTRNVLFTVESTDPMVPWLSGYFETILVQMWYPITVATSSFFQKRIIKTFLEETAENSNSLPFKLHDFGYRGVSSVESAAIGGAAHLVNFQGTDTLASLALTRKYYYANIAGYSVPATEHSTVTSWGRNGELDACRNMLERFPTGIISCVSDSYDLWHCCEHIWGKELKELVEARGNVGGCLVVRPDSGDPATVVLQVTEMLGKSFGTRINSKGFKELPSYVRVIQGDGVSYETLGQILQNMKKHGWSAENLTFGSGGALLQKVDRDTQKCAYKCSYAVVNGEAINVYKQPITDPGKHSKKGRLTLHKKNGNYLTIEEGRGDPETDILVTVYENGYLLVEETLDKIRQRANQALDEYEHEYRNGHSKI